MFELDLRSDCRGILQQVAEIIMAWHLPRVTITPGLLVSWYWCYIRLWSERLTPGGANGYFILLLIVISQEFTALIIFQIITFFKIKMALIILHHASTNTTYPLLWSPRAWRSIITAKAVLNSRNIWENNARSLPCKRMYYSQWKKNNQLTINGIVLCSRPHKKPDSDIFPSPGVQEWSGGGQGLSGAVRGCLAGRSFPMYSNKQTQPQYSISPGERN